MDLWKTRSAHQLYSWDWAAALTFFAGNLCYLTSALLCFGEWGYDFYCELFDILGGVIFVFNAFTMMFKLSQKVACVRAPSARRWRDCLSRLVADATPPRRSTSKWSRERSTS